MLLNPAHLFSRPVSVRSGATLTFLSGLKLFASEMESVIDMKRLSARFFLLIFPALFSLSAAAQTPAPRLEKAAKRSASSTPRATPASQMLFGSIALSTRSEESRKYIELALDKYENAMYDDAVATARHATQKDPQSPLSYAVLSFAARRGMPDSAALAKAKSLLSRATPDEQLLARWMVSVQERNLLPAIVNMNELLQRYPRDKHILYLTGEWLFLQQDDDRARATLETALQMDPDFPAALNRLGYVYMETGTPDPAKAIASLMRYAEVLPNSANPQDSLGELLRVAGHDQSSLEHYRAALRIDPAYLSSQYGLGDTYTLMSDFKSAREEYDRAIQKAQNTRDELYVKYQKALVYFWEGQAEEGRKALDLLFVEAANKKEPNELFDIGLGSAMLAATPQEELSQLGALSVFLEQPLPGMSEADRGVARASVLRERLRVIALNGLADDLAETLSKLEAWASSSGDLHIQEIYETARGYLSFRQGDLAHAAEQLAADSHSPLALQQLEIVEQKLGKTIEEVSAQTRLTYQRGPTVEWYLVEHSHSGEPDSQAR
jgi:tetratricopeptide (TPR) repeat protein